MKTTILLTTAFIAILLSFCEKAKAQFVPSPQYLDKFETLDSCLVKVYYDLDMYPSPTNRKTVYQDVQFLEIGKNLVKCSSYLLYQRDSLSTASVARGGDAFLIQQQILPTETYLSHKDKKTTLTYRTILGGPILRYTEPTENIVWNIEAETDTIIGYPCQKATCLFRGRTYQAWFSMELPLRYGPYKFHGLPGLILKISDSENEYIWTCNHIEKASAGETIKRYKWKYEDTSKVKMEEMIQRIFDKPYTFCESFGLKFRIKQSDGSFGNRGADVAMPYLPLEK